MPIGTAPTALPTDELLDLLEFGIPLKWQQQMYLQGFEPINRTVNEFVEFCTQLEAVLEDPRDSKKPAKSSTEPAGGQDKKTDDRNKKRRCNNDGSKYW